MCLIMYLKHLIDLKCRFKITNQIEPLHEINDLLHIDDVKLNTYLTMKTIENIRQYC